MCWDETLKVMVKSMNKNVVNAYISDQHSNNFWITCLYGHPELHLRQQAWDQLLDIAQNINKEDEWIVIGDFNQPFYHNDNLSFNNSNLRGAQAMIACLDESNLSEIPPKGPYLTLTNNRQGKDVVWERLDRGFADYNWFKNHENALLINLPVVRSDHGAMILYTKKDEGFHKRPYHFEAMWITHPSCEKVIKNYRNIEVTGSPSFKLALKIKLVRNDLKRWNKEVFGNLQVRKNLLEDELKGNST